MREDPTRPPRRVVAMFDAISSRYDLANDILSGFRDRSWRRETVAALDLEPGEKVLDVAAGTGTSAVAIAGAEAHVVGADFSLGMLAVAASRPARLALAASDALRLPFADASFDAATISFGLRNTADPKAALVEMFRVTRPGGRLVVCEFAQPSNRLVRAAYTPYLYHVLPRLAKALTGESEAYAYLASSIKTWPDRRALAALIAESGWRNVAFRDLTGGIVVLHRARRPLGDGPAFPRRAASGPGR